ncbi:PREDICTED: THO complex subunit 5B-like isoform X1 [Nicotiana attenuata]|uniref:Tho complex subunit 5b n=1 Tax=Nicotiana attenuata TaxID=49451 RepID=A0A1J6J2R0_NICAT|nr:PREDICTED: THO complex subunit 5B-like isoform X1 [Nicotiana attenuata]OIT04175.1 tho complex subunit 5b [Nicotiana attenuata]
MEITMGEPGEILPEHKPEKSPYEVLQQSKASVEEIVSKMLSIKKESTPKSELRELVTQILINFVSLRQANRSILLDEDRVKGETERAKAPVDFTTLQLHNLMYEKSHYVKAIKACKDFRSKYPDIELVPEEEFFKDAPEEIKSSVMSKDSSHNLMLKRLNYELFQRKELCKLREKLEQKKKALQETIANRKKFLSSLPSHLKSLKKASLPVQHQLGVLHTKKLKQLQYAELLPPPLYVIYSQLMAQKEAFGENVELEIVGSVKDAQAVARQQANKDTGVSASLESSKVDDDIDEEDDGQGRRKRPKKIPSKESLEQAGIYQTHPLKVTLHIHDDEIQSTKLVTLKFEYLIKLNIVCVGVEGSQENPHNDILCNLFPDDTGLELPRQSAKLIDHSIVFDERRTSRPYKWVQHLAGIDFLPEVSPSLRGFETSNDETAKHAAVISGLSLYRQQNRVQTVVQRIRARKKAQLALAEQFDSLMNLNWPVLAGRSVPWASHDPRCSLHAWVPLCPTPSQVSTLAVAETEQVQLPTEVVVDGKSASSKEEVESTREDGELPSLVPVTSINDTNVTPNKRINFDPSTKLAFISKSASSPIIKGKSPSFKKYGDDADLILESDSEVDDTVQVEQDSNNTPGLAGFSDKSWVDCKVQEYCLVLTRKMDNEERKMKLESMIKISKEYPLRPPLFTLSLYEAIQSENYSKVDSSVWYNELRSMEAEVNAHIINAIPADEENLVLAHQVRCLALLFDFYAEDGESSSEKRKSTSVIDVGLCKPMTGQLVARSFRGRDHRKMISWKDSSCTPGYPY